MEKKGETNVGYFVVLFVDLLGQKDRLRKITELPDPNNKVEMRDFEAKVKNTKGVVECFYDAFEGYFESYKEQLSKPISERHKQLPKSSRIRFQPFSDGIVVYLPTGEDAEYIPVQDVVSLFGACASNYLLFMSKGFPLRGGIEIGIGFETEKYGLYGPVVLAIHELENQIARYPRIVIGTQLLHYLQSEKSLTGNDIIAQYRRNMAQTCLDMVEEDTDGYSVLDVLGKSFKENIAREIMADVPIKAYDFVLRQLDEWKSKRNTKLTSRYQMLKNYFDKKLDIWIRE